MPSIHLALRAASAVAVAGLLSLGSLSAADAETPGIQVMMNQAKIVKVARPIDTIVIGNSAIVDASVQDQQTIVLTGKGFGQTNVVVLDQQGSPIVDQQVTVSRQDAGSVRVYRRAQIQTLSCTPYCEGAYKSDAERLSETEMSSQ